MAGRGAGAGVSAVLDFLVSFSGVASFASFLDVVFIVGLAGVGWEIVFLGSADFFSGNVIVFLVFVVVLLVAAAFFVPVLDGLGVAALVFFAVALDAAGFGVAFAGVAFFVAGTVAFLTGAAAFLVGAVTFFAGAADFLAGAAA